MVLFQVSIGEHWWAVHCSVVLSGVLPSEHDEHPPGCSLSLVCATCDGHYIYSTISSNPIGDCWLLFDYTLYFISHCYTRHYLYPEIFYCPLKTRFSKSVGKCCLNNLLIYQTMWSQDRDVQDWWSMWEKLPAIYMWEIGTTGVPGTSNWCRIVLTPCTVYLYRSTESNIIP